MSEPSESNFTGRRRPRLQFSLLALFIILTAACFLVAWLAQPEQCEAVALFRVIAIPPTLAHSRPAAFDPREFELLQNSHVEMIRSEFVLQAAVRNPGIATLPILSSRSDPAEWLAKNINAEFLQGSEVLSISLRGPASRANDLTQIVDAVARAYQDEVVYETRQRELIHRDAKARSVAELQGELAEEMHKLEAIISESGGADSVDAKLRQLQIDVLTHVLRDLSIELEHADVESTGPDRIQKIQPAIVRFD